MQMQIFSGGISPGRISFVGNVMIDSLLNNLKRAEASAIRKKLKVVGGEYVVVTLHRLRMWDNQETLGRILDAITEIAERLPVIFPVHPRTREKLKEFGYETELLRFWESPNSRPFRLSGFSPTIQRCMFGAY